VEGAPAAEPVRTGGGVDAADRDVDVDEHATAAVTVPARRTGRIAGFKCMA